MSDRDPPAAPEPAEPAVPATGAAVEPLQEGEVYAAIGEAGFAALVGAFYRRVPGDPILGPMYPPADMVAAEVRLRDFLIFRFGGPPRYIEARGHPRLRMRHAPFAVDVAARHRWVELMEQAFAEAGLPTSAEATLRRFFHGTATFMINRNA